MGWTAEVTDDAKRDLDRLADHLVRSSMKFGEDRERATSNALRRLRDIVRAVRMLEANPFRGTLHPDLGPTTRTLTVNRAILWFETDDANLRIRLLGGGQDHIRHMTRRLLGKPAP